ncbi:MAG: exodeoxyribonuclease VII large subunit [Planctomycetia bacterium]|nr:exodeoxyribonuclease VII large subunit [Planctomycetia bacterium]
MSSLQQNPFSITDLTLMMKSLIEETFSDIWVVGEISNLSQPKSGHCYLTLKDENAQLSAAIWRPTMSKVKFSLKNGLKIVCRGRIDVYPPHGKYQMIITQLEPQGVGALELAFRQLHEKLSAEGLFLASRKKQIPKVLRKIAVITSPTGAAIRDFLNVLGRRSKRVDVIIVPVKVQGSGASKEIAQAFEMINNQWKMDKPDALALIRGGGSVEDLWSFNEELVVRALAASRIPTITGIGHEIDVSLCDLAADLHALTPSDAAARIVPEDDDLRRYLIDFSRRLHFGIDRKIDFASSLIQRLKNRNAFLSPEQLIIESRQILLSNLQKRQENHWDRICERSEHQLSELAGRLESLSPLAVLGRGYSITQKENGTIIRNASDVQNDEMIQTKLAHGILKSRIIECQN